MDINFLITLGQISAFSIGNREDDPLQKVSSSSLVVACKITATALLKGDVDVVGCEALSVG